MSATAWAWLVLLLPLLGSIVISLGFRAIPARVAGAIGTAAIGLAFLCAVAALVDLLGDEPDARTTPPRSGPTRAPAGSTSSSASTSTSSPLS
jgi:hypothetical protein